MPAGAARGAAWRTRAQVGPELGALLRPQLCAEPGLPTLTGTEFRFHYVIIKHR